MRKVLNALRYLEEGLMALAVLCVVLINFASIVTREIDIGIQFGQAQEVMLLMFVWITFLGIPLAARKKSHLGLSILTDALPPKAKKAAAHVKLAVSIWFLITLGWFGLLMVMKEYQSLQKTPSLGLPLWPFGSAIVVSAVLTVIRLLEVAYDELWHKQSGEVTQQ
ncbi:MAG TPA: TRAP transporter small permease subunit [Symbiobacteriaceae bacterium]|jgi:C4-dicarboxylate transporter DctQ subunit